MAQIAATQFNTWDGGPTFAIEYDAVRSQIKVSAEVPDENWFGICFGDTMDYSDMVIMRAKGNGVLSDLWSTGHWTPKIDY